MKTYIYIRSPFVKLLAVVFLLFGTTFTTIASSKDKKTFEVSVKVVDADGNGLSDVSVYANEGVDISQTDAEGNFNLDAEEGSVILLEADGYQSKSFTISELISGKVELQKNRLLAGANDVVYLPMWQKTSQRHLVGAISKIDREDIEKYADPLLSNTLQGMAAGLNVVMATGGMANNPPTVYVRGLNRVGDSNGPIYIVDGVERVFDDINPEELETVEILKDATAKILYGARAANGVVMVTTRHGVAYKREIKVKVESGVGMVTRMPEFLNSYDYATLYNQARANDGLTPVYSGDDLEGYANSTGENDLLHPDVDYYDYFLRNTTNYSKVTTEFSGGNQNATYAVMMGYMGYKGLQKIGPEPRQDRFNLRANLDANITEDISAFMGLTAIIDYWKASGLNHSSTFAALSSHRPNEYPFVIDESYIEPTNKGVPALGGSYKYPANLLGSLKYGGDATDQFLNQQMNAGLNFKLDDFVEGLSARAMVTFDNYVYGKTQKTQAAATYLPQEYIYSDAVAGGDSIQFLKLKTENTNVNYSLASNETTRRTSVSGQFDYTKKIGDGQLNSTLGYYYYMLEKKGGSQNIVNENAFLRSNYAIDDKYIIEADLSLVGSNRFAKGNRHFLSSALGAAWIISEEDFMNSESIDFLKLKASWGCLGYDAATSHYLYENTWSNSGTASFGEQNSGDKNSRTTLNVWGNSDLKWEKSKELNIGIEGLAFDQRLMFETNYFNNSRTDIIGKVSALYPSYYGPYYSSMNYSSLRNQGVELDIRWSDNKGDFSYSVGANITYSKNKVLQKDEVTYSDDRMTVGKSSDVIMGYKSLGLYGKDVPLAGAPIQTFGPYQEGDIAYEDVNGDGFIDNLDKVEIGNSLPRTSIGVNFDLSYKGFGLYVLGTSSLGVYRTFSNAYYRNSGEGKYSILANDAYHPTENPTGDQPRLTTTSNSNNTVTSDFWTKNANFFRLKNVELSYTFDLKTDYIKSMKLFARGNNLFVMSSVKDLDPEAVDGGVSNYPVLSTITGGLAISF